MIIFILVIFTIICGIGLYVHGYENGFIDGKLDEKWRTKDARRNKNNSRNS